MGFICYIKTVQILNGLFLGGNYAGKYTTIIIY